jgi:hypothetical protein
MKLFEKNVGMADRAMRIVLGFGIMGYSGAYIAPPLSYVLILIGIILALTGTGGTCAIYSLLGISTDGAAPKAAKKKRAR